MKQTILKCAALFAAASTTLAIQAASVPLQQLITTQGTLTAGDKVFADFGYSGDPSKIDPANIMVEAVSLPGGLLGLKFTGGIVAVGEIVDIGVFYSVATLNGMPTITAIGQSFMLSAAGDGGVVIVGETVWSMGFFTGSSVAQSSVGFADVIDPPGEVVQGDQLIISPPRNKVWVTKDIFMAPANENASVGLAELTQVFCQNTIEIICANDKTVECDEPWTFDAPIANNSCCPEPISIVPVNTVTNLGICGGNYTATRTWQISDGCGNLTNCMQTVTVRDLTPPVFVLCPPDADLGCNPAFIPDCNTQFEVVDTCGTVTLSCSSVTVTNGCVRTRTITYVALDECENMATCEYRVTWIRDVIPPQLTCPSDLDLGCNPAEIPGCEVDSVTAMDDCGPVTLACSILDTTNGCVVTRRLTYQATDICTNQASCFRTITWIQDTNPPVFVACPPNITLGCNPTNIPNCDMPSVSATDDCGAVTLSCAQVDGANGCVRTRTITYTATDRCENESTCTQVITWFMDNAPPNITCEEDFEVECGTDWVFDMPSASDDCDGATIEIVSTVTNTPTTRCPIVFSVTRTWKATDVCGNTATCSQTATVVDIHPPNIVCEEDFEVECNTDWVFDRPSAVDKCDGTNVVIMVVATVTNTPATRCPIIFSVTRTWKATDTCGNEAFCSQTATIVDIFPPNITCEDDFQLECGGDWVFDRPSAVDKCDGTNVVIVVVATVTNTPATRCPIIFSVTRTWKATDTCGNEAFCSQTATIVDTLPPNLTCAHDQIVECGGPFAFTPPFALDVCDGTNVVVQVVDTVTNNVSPQCPALFAARRTWSATDTCGNRSFCSQTITMVDSTPPSIFCADDRVVQCGVPWNFTAPVAIDLCSTTTVVIVETKTNAACGSTFSATRSWRATDACGNFATCSQTILVVDTRPPDITCAPDRLLECGTPWTFSPPTATDLCDGPVQVTLGTTTTNNLCGNTYSATRTWSATDACGNTAVCSQSVTLIDTRPPTISCSNNRVLECGTPWTFTPPSANDFCDGPNVPITVVGTVTNTLCGTTYSATRTWEATDMCGNKATCSQTVFLVDTVPPTLVGIPTYPNPFLCFGDVPPPPNVTAFDLCDPNVTVTFSAVTNGVCPSIITRCWTARDACSNSVTECQFLLVSPRPPVLLSGPSDQTVCAGDSVTFCAQVSSACPVKYQWTKDGANVANQTNACLVLGNVTVADAGEYCIQIMGECQSLTNCARLTVVTNTMVTVNPPACIPRGSNATICPIITGSGPFTCVWRRIQDINGVLVTNVVSTDCCLTINNYSESQAGTYQITVTGRCNSGMATISLCPVIDASSIPISVVGQFPPASGPCLGAPVTLCTPLYAGQPITYRWFKGGVEIANANDRCVTTALDASPTTFMVVAAGCCPATNTITLGCEPCIKITKTANRPTVAPGGLITYSYSVTNCGGLNLTNLTIVDDNGTPNSLADDFIVTNGVSLAVGEVKQFTFSKNAPTMLCGPDGLTGRLEVMDLGDRFRAIFFQDFSVNNNAYGTSAAQFGWTKSHSFNNLTGSDKAEFTFRNAGGTIVFKGALDYITSSSSYPSGYGTLGVDGGDGKVSVGNASSVLGFSTSLTENLNKEPFLSNPQYRVNSPASGDPNLAVWENQMVYTLDIAKSAFGASGFGSVAITDQHNSPENGAPRPPCDFCITNVAVVTAVATGLNGPAIVTDMDDARVCISTNPNVCIDVIKEVACLLPNDACGVFGKVATGLKGDSDVGFCYSITVTNCGEVALTNLTVLDDKLGSLTTLFFPTPQTALPVGGSVTRFVKMAWGVDTTNTVTATGRGATTGAPQVNARDSAIARVDIAGLSCISWVTSPCDEDGNPMNNHVQLPTNNAPCVVTFTTVVCNNGDVAFSNVTIHQPALAGFCDTSIVIGTLAAGACVTNTCTVTLTCQDAPIVNEVTVTANADAGDRCAFDFDGQPMTYSSSCRSFVECGGQPCFDLIKTVDRPIAPLGSSVTYTYTVTNCGGTTLTDITVTDDNGTPGLLSDDFEVGTIASLPPGGTSSLTHTVTLPTRLCDDQTGDQSGLLITEVLPNGNIKATFIQDFAVNDNTYGVNSIGWGKKVHQFKNLVGSDQATFEFRNGQGQVVLGFKLDYISAITPTAQFPAGYRSLGPTGGDGGVKTGNAASVLSWSTSLEENLNKPPFLNNLAQYTMDSPALSDPNSPLWEYRMIYAVVIDKNAFGGSGFGSVMITDQHNSPSKKGVSGPEVCGGCITNIATGTAISGSTTLSAMAFATVCSSTNPPSRTGECPQKADFYKKNPNAYPAGYSPNQTVGSVFAKASLYSGTANKTLAEALDGKGSSNSEVKELLKEAVAALLNAASPNIAYPFTEADIIDGVNMVLMSGNKDNIKGLKDLLKDANKNDKNCGQSGGDENCDTAGKPNVLTFRYNGQSCAAAQNAQMAKSGKTSCSGDPMNAATVRIIATSSSSAPSGSSDRFFDANVSLNQQFEVKAGSSKFGSNTYLYIYNGATLVQSIQVHTSCSAPLVRGDSFGALVLVDYRIEP